MRNYRSTFVIERQLVVVTVRGMGAPSLAIGAITAVYALTASVSVVLTAPPPTWGVLPTLAKLGNLSYAALFPTYSHFQKLLVQSDLS